MIKSFSAAISSLGLVLGASIFSQASAQELDLYVDTVTKQVYTAPGKNRVKMGTFQQVQKDSGRQAKKRLRSAGTSISRHRKNRGQASSTNRCL